MSECVMRRNTEMFYKVADQIEREPEKYDQGTYYTNLAMTRAGWEGRDCPAEQAECGTRACIAGWATLIKNDVKYIARRPHSFFPESDISSIGQRALGLSGWEADVLFHSKWEPHDGLSVPDALRKIGEGAKLQDVTKPGTQAAAWAKEYDV